MSKKKTTEVIATVTHVAFLEGWGGKKTYIRYDLSNDAHIYVLADTDPLNLDVGSELVFIQD